MRGARYPSLGITSFTKTCPRRFGRRRSPRAREMLSAATTMMDYDLTTHVDQLQRAREATVVLC
jgi:hypothetical protein